MITIVCSTQKPLGQYKDTVIKACGLKDVQFLEYINDNQFSLTEIYNKGLQESTNDIVVFLHNDLEFDTDKFGKKIIDHFQENEDYGILGLAGTSSLPDNGIWWTDRSKMVGIVNHKHEGKKWESRYSVSLGKKLADVVLVDGLFFAVHKNRIKETFSEDVTGFHFYEVDFMTKNHLSGVKIGVMFDVRVTHLSIGMTNEQWDENRNKFISKFKEDLPISITPNVDYSTEKIGNLKDKVFVFIQTGNDFKKLDTQLEHFNQNEKHENIKIVLLSNSGNFDYLKSKYDNTGYEIISCYYDNLAANFGVVRYSEFLSQIKNEDLICLMTQNATPVNNFISVLYKQYKNNRPNFGCSFPTTINEDKTVFCSRLDILKNKENKVQINMKDVGTFYNLKYGTYETDFGNLSEVLFTTKENLVNVGFLESGYDTPLFFNDFALKCKLRNRKVYTNTDSIVAQTSFKGSSSIDGDFTKLLQLIGSNQLLMRYVKEVA